MGPLADFCWLLACFHSALRQFGKGLLQAQPWMAWINPQISLFQSVKTGHPFKHELGPLADFCWLLACFHSALRQFGKGLLQAQPWMAWINPQISLFQSVKTGHPFKHEFILRMYHVMIISVISSWFMMEIISIEFMLFPGPGLCPRLTIPAAGGGCAFAPRRNLSSGSELR